MEHSGDKYAGESYLDRCEGKGKYDFDNGDCYVGDFKDGMFHGKGILYFKEFGKFEGEWRDGVAKKGNYVFNDGLNFREDNWNYCSEKDSRFYGEQQLGITPTGIDQ